MRILKSRCLQWLGSLILIIPSLSFASENLLSNDYVESFLKGYSSEEIELIKEDLANIEKLCFRQVTPVSKEERLYIATAGGPGASKSTILEKHLEDKKNFAYLDPDQRALRFMINTYLQEFTNQNIEKSKTHTRADWETLLQKAYTKWRGASNYITSVLLNEAFAKGDNIAHGTTSTSEQVGNLYKKLKADGYKLTLLLSYTTDNNRVNALTHRGKNQNFIQVDPIDVINKGKLFPERFPVYFENADHLEFYWTDDFLKGSTHAATLIRGKELVIHNKTAMKKFINKYNEDRKGKEWKPLEYYFKNFI